MSTFYDVDLQDNDIRLICTAKCEAVPEKGYFPAYKFNIALLDGTPIGKCDLRIGHNSNTYYGGNIGYAVDEPYRGHHYASKACILLFQLAAMHDMDYVTITCDVSNIASSRTCQIAGGMLIDTTEVPKDSDLRDQGIEKVHIYKFLVSTMPLLLTIDAHDYDIHGKIYNRHSVRGIIIRDHKTAMAHVMRYGYYKFPGGGTDGTETQHETLIREVKEEAGLVVKPQSIRPFGIIRRMERNKRGEFFSQDNYYFICDAEDEVKSQELTEKEAQDGYTLEFVDPKVAIQRSWQADIQGNVKNSITRETFVLQKLIDEGYFD